MSELASLSVFNLTAKGKLQPVWFTGRKTGPVQAGRRLSSYDSGDRLQSRSDSELNKWL